MLKKIVAIISAFSFVLAILSGCSGTETNKVVTSADFTEEQLDSSAYNTEKYTTPFWEGNIVYNEIIFPMYNENAEVPPFDLMYNASEIVSVKDYSLTKTYTEGVDYALENGKLVILPGSEIAVSGYSLIHREGVPDILPDDLLVNLNKDGTEYFDVLNNLFKKTISVTYIHNDTWNYHLPEYNSDSLKKTKTQMENGEETTIVVLGDSVSVGYSASKVVDMAPYADSYVDMVTKQLKNHYNNENINVINSSVGGAKADFTEEQLTDDVINHNPSAVIIALGTNDAMSRKSVEDYISDIRYAIEFISNKLPKCEFIIVTPHLSNPRVFDINYYKDYREGLYGISNEFKNVEICDPLAIESDLIEKTNKNFVCFTIDNLVHKNDYGMRIIAQCVLEALTE